jgi:hypothetical protein
MHQLHHVIRALRGETEPRTDHLAVFREFLGHLDRVAANARNAGAARRARTDRDAKSNGGKNGKT